MLFNYEISYNFVFLYVWWTWTTGYILLVHYKHLKLRYIQSICRMRAHFYWSQIINETFLCHKLTYNVQTKFYVEKCINNTFKTCLLSNYLRSRQNTFMTVQRKQSNLFFFEVDQWILLLKIQQLFKPDNDYPFFDV